MATPHRPHEPDRPDEGGAHAAPRPAPSVDGPAAPESPGPPVPEATDPTVPDASGPAHAAPTRATSPAPARGSSDQVVEEDLRTGAPARPAPDDDDDQRTDPAPPAPAVPPPADGAGRAPEADGRRERTRTEVVEAPPKRGVGRHVLGVLVGLVLTPVAFLLTGIGGARLADIAGTSRMGTDTLGVVLLSTGIAVLVAVVLLGVWSAAVPITGGVFWGLVLGVAYLVVPRDVERTVEDVSGGTVPAALEQFGQSAMSGLLLLVGVLLLASGVATAVARRSGRRYGTAVVEHEHTSRRGETARA